MQRRKTTPENTYFHFLNLPESWNSKPQYFGHLMQRTDSLEKTLMLRKTEGRRRRRRQEDGMAGWHHRFNGHEFKRTLGDGEGQGSLECCSPWGRKESDTTERLTTTSISEVKEFTKIISEKIRTFHNKYNKNNYVLFCFYHFLPIRRLHISFIIAIYFSNELGRKENITWKVFVSRTSGGSREEEMEWKNKKREKTLFFSY